MSSGTSDLSNIDMSWDLQYNTIEWAAIVTRYVPVLNDEQKSIYDHIMLAPSAGQEGFFLFGGTAKIFLISILLLLVRLKLPLPWL